MHAMVLDLPRPVAERPLLLRTQEDPPLAEDEIALRVVACGVCRTDLQLCEGDLGAHKLPVVPGHQIVGIVERVGPRVEGWRVGDRAGVAWLATTCGRCAYCASGRENLCAGARFTGWDRDGGYAARCVARGDFALHLPEGFADHDVAPLLCGGVIGYRSLKVCGIKAGGRLGLFGFGASALLAIQVARHWGCEVHVCTRSAKEQERATALGAAWAGGYDARPPALLDAAITFAPSGDVVVAALRALARGGTVAINAIHLDRVPQLDYQDLWWERAIKSVANFTRADATEFLALAASIPVKTSIETHPLADANLALQRLSRGEVDGAAVLVP
jgi:propanol-preferring alcohol dehydrogenase